MDKETGVVRAKSDENLRAAEPLLGSSRDKWAEKTLPGRTT